MNTLAIYISLIWLKLRTCLGRRENLDALVVIKLDEIGDYILFRNFLTDIKQSMGQPGRKLVLIASSGWKDFAMALDGDIVDIAIAANNRPGSPLSTWYPLFRQVATWQPAYVINASYNRKPLSDYLAFLMRAKNKLAFTPPLQTSTHAAKWRKNWYTQLIDTAPVIHEFDRNRQFFATVTGQLSSRLRPQIDRVPAASIALQPPYALVFIGGTDAGRKWPADAVASMIGHIGEHIDLYLVGGPDDRPQAQLVLQRQPQVKDLTGQTKLTDLPALVKQAAWVVGNESGFLHLAVALDTQAVCITGGGHFARFMPYPENRKVSAKVVYHHMPCYNCDWICIYDKAPDAAYPCVAAVEVSAVLEALSTIHLA